MSDLDTSQPPPQTVLSLAPGVEFSTRTTGDRTSYVACHADMGKYFRFGAEEHHIACLIDGARTASDIHAEAESDGLDWSSQDVADFVGQLVQHKIVIAAQAVGAAGVADETSGHPRDSQPVSSPSAGARPPNALGRVTSLLSMVVSQRFPLFDGQRIANKFESTFGRLFTTGGLIVWLFAVISGFCVVYGHRYEFHGEIKKLFDPAIWPMLMGIWLVAKVIHEIGHAVAAHRHGVRVGQMGVMFFLFAPLAYVDVTDAWKLKSRWSRVQIALAGVYLELAIAALAAWAWWWLPGGLCRHLAAQVFLIAGPTTLLVNANPLLRLDGYYVLSDLLEIPNLRMHGRKQLGGKIERWLIGIPTKPALLSGWRRSVATVHAASSVVFQFFWMGGLVIAVSMWARGLGILMAVVATLLWGLIPLGRWFHRVWTMEPGQRFGLNPKRKRLIGLAGTLLAMVQYFSATTSPLDRRVPVVVRYHNEQISRAVVDAFVDGVHVQHGQRVSQGQLLIELRQPELVLEHQSLADDFELAKQRAVQHRRVGEIALADAKTQEAESLQRRIDESSQRVSNLRIVAQRDGLVTTPNLQRLVGRYIHQGDELVRVSDPAEKEVLVAVSERDMDAYQIAASNNRRAKVRLRGGGHIEALPKPLRPRARIQLPHPAMSAMVGGPLAVQTSDDPQHPMQLVEPQLEGVTPLDAMTSAMVSAGQLGTMTISDNRPLLARVYDAIVDDAARLKRQ